MATWLVVDDEQSIGWGLRRLGERNGHRVLTASSAEQALEMLPGADVDLIVLDVRLPGMDGLTAMEPLRRVAGNVPVVVVTAHGDLHTAVEAVRQGAFEYLVKPFDMQRVQQVLNRAMEQGNTSESPPPVIAPVEGFVGRTPAMQEAFHQIALAATTEAPVLLQGESGTGKELAARAIHKYSSRAAMPLVIVNVASLSPALAESELFGHVRGAFTGADQARPGLLVRANGGTLFLDEIADIPLPTQVKLLRVLEQGEVTPVGSDTPVTTNFRVISATHQDLQSLVRSGGFRHDLYFRVSAFRIALPPLRQRSEDILALAEHFLNALTREGAVRCRLSCEAVEELKQRPWYGNVRELRNAMEHAVIVARSGTIGPEHLPEVALPPPLHHELPALPPEAQIVELLRRWTQEQLASVDQAGELYAQLLELVEPPVLQAVLDLQAGQCLAAAKVLGIHRTTVRKKMDQYGLGDAANDTDSL